jgi:hypothetical protein
LGCFGREQLPIYLTPQIIAAFAAARRHLKIVRDRNAFRAKERGLPMVNSELTPSVSHDPKNLVGTWTLVSVVTERDGRRFDTYGPNAKGHLVFDAIGRYSIIFISGGLPKFASGNRSSGTADGSKAVVAGSFAHFGTYVADEVDKSFTFQVERATFPNWDGNNTKRSFGIRGDELHFTDPHSSGGGVATTIFERATRAR